LTAEAIRRKRLGQLAEYQKYHVSSTQFAISLAHPIKTLIVLPRLIVP